MWFVSLKNDLFYVQCLQQCWRVPMAFPSVLDSAAHPECFSLEEVVPAVPQALLLPFWTPVHLLTSHYTYVVIKLIVLVKASSLSWAPSSSAKWTTPSLVWRKKELKGTGISWQILLNSFFRNTVNSYRIHLIRLAHNPVTSQKSLFASLGLKFFNNTLEMRMNFALFSKWTPSCNFWK